MQKGCNSSFRPRLLFFLPERRHVPWRNFWLLLIFPAPWSRARSLIFKPVSLILLLDVIFEFGSFIRGVSQPTGRIFFHLRNIISKSVFRGAPLHLPRRTFYSPDVSQFWLLSFSHARCRFYFQWRNVKVRRNLFPGREEDTQFNFGCIIDYSFILKNPLWLLCIYLSWKKSKVGLSQEKWQNFDCIFIISQFLKKRSIVSLYNF